MSNDSNITKLETAAKEFARVACDLEIAIDGGAFDSESDIMFTMQDAIERLAVVVERHAILGEESGSIFKKDLLALRNELSRNADEAFRIGEAMQKEEAIED